MSTLKVDTILKRTGTGTITLGQAGDTISIPSGATLSNQGTTVPTSFGKIAQVVSAISNNGTTTSSNNTWTDTDLTVSITPSATSSKIKLEWWGQTNLTMTGAAFVFYIDFERAISGGATTSQIVSAAADGNFVVTYGYDNRSAGATLVDSLRNRSYISYIDSPSTTSAITYTCQFNANAWSGSSGTDGFYDNGYIVASEILA